MHVTILLLRYSFLCVCAEFHVLTESICPHFKQNRKIVLLAHQYIEIFQLFSNNSSKCESISHKYFFILFINGEFKLEKTLNKLIQT